MTRQETMPDPIVISVCEGKLSKQGATTGKKVPELAKAVHAGRPWEASSTKGAVCALARLLVQNGVQDCVWETRGEDGKRRLYGPSLRRLAKLTVTDDVRGVNFRKWVPYPGFGEPDDEQMPAPPVEVGWAVSVPA
jgi:hypothetical protein